MDRVAFTLRIDAEERAALEILSKVEGRPINQLLNEAIKTFLSRRGRKERSLEASLAGLKAYRKRDPRLKRAIAAFVDAEASLAASQDDPLEGVPVNGHFVELSLHEMSVYRHSLKRIVLARCEACFGIHECRDSALESGIPFPIGFQARQASLQTAFFSAPPAEEGLDGLVQQLIDGPPFDLTEDLQRSALLSVDSQRESDSIHGISLSRPAHDVN